MPEIDNYLEAIRLYHRVSREVAEATRSGNGSEALAIRLQRARGACESAHRGAMRAAAEPIYSLMRSKPIPYALATPDAQT